MLSKFFGFFLFVFLCLPCWVVSAQVQPTWDWQRNYGGSLHERSNALELMDDGSIIAVGSSDSDDKDVSENQGGTDIWVLHLENSNSIIWERSFGGSGDEIAYDVRQTGGGGYIVAGSTNSTDGDVHHNHGGTDAWLIKLDTAGNIEWERTYGGSGEDIAYAIQQTDDGGYVVAGETNSRDGDVSPHPLGGNLWVFKTDNKGSLLWEHTYGGSGNEAARGIKQTTDGGYIVAGHTSSTDGDVSFNKGGYDIWMLKLIPDGRLDWEKSFGGDKDDYASDSYYYMTGNDCIQQTPDDGYVLVGRTSSNVGGRTQDRRSSNAWVLRLNSQGSVIWDYAYGGTSFEGGSSIFQTIDGNFIVSGFATSKDGDLISDPPLGTGENTWVFKIDSLGKLIWSHTYGESSGSSDIAIQGCDIIVSGFHTGGPGYDVKETQGIIDFWVIKLRLEPPPPTAKSPQKFCVSSQPIIADLEARGKNLNWYENDKNSKILADTLALKDGATYYVSQTIDGCEGKRTPVDVKVEGQTPPTITSDSTGLICLNASVMYTTDSGYTGYTWIISGGDILDGGGDEDDFVEVLWNTTENTSVSISYDLGSSCGMSQVTRYSEDVDLCDIALDKTVNKSKSIPGSEVTFTVTATNLGDYDFQDVTIEENIPSGFKLLSHHASSGTYNAQSGLWLIPFLAGRQTVTLDLVVQVLEQGDHQNTASLTSSTPEDSNLSNNTARAEVELINDCIVQAPKGFSPNGDGYNEVFLIRCIEDYPNNSVKIYSRYGRLVYEVRSYDNQKRVFNGHSKNGKVLPAGTYYYIIKTADKNYKGWVYLQR